MNSRDKGKRGELELAKVLRDLGYDTRRGQQYNGADGSPDVVGLQGIHIECKRVEKLNVEEALRQAERDARPGEVAVVMHRANNQKWKATLRLEDLMVFYEAWRGGK